MKTQYILLAAVCALTTASCTTIKTQTDSILNEANTNKQFESSVAKIDNGYEVSSYASTTVMGIKPYAALVVGYRKEPKSTPVEGSLPVSQSK